LSYVLFVVCLGLTWVTRPKHLGYGKHARPNVLGSDYNVRPRSLGLATMSSLRALGLTTMSSARPKHESDIITRPRQTQASWGWQPCTSALWTKTQYTVDFHSGFFKLWRLGMRLMLFFHIKLNYHFALWLKKMKPWLWGYFSIFYRLISIKCFSGGMIVFWWLFA
jgi:hypothetical protein